MILSADNSMPRALALEALDMFDQMDFADQEQHQDLVLLACWDRICPLLPKTIFN